MPTGQPLASHCVIGPMAEIVQDENAIDPYENLEDKTVNGMLEEMVTKLDPREATDG